MAGVSIDAQILKARTACGDDGGTALRWLLDHRPPVALPTRSWFEEALAATFFGRTAADVLDCLVSKGVVQENDRGELTY